MSYILEALKKADRERMVGHVPDLEVVHTVIPQPRRSNRWYWLLGVLLVINGLLVAGLVLRDGDSGVPGGEAGGMSSEPASSATPMPVPERAAAAAPDAEPESVQAATIPSPQRELPWKTYYQPPARQEATAARPAAQVETTTGAAPAASGAGSVVYLEEPLTDEPATTVPEAPGDVSPPVLGATGGAPEPQTEPSESVLPDWDDLPLEFRSSFQVPRIDVHVYDTNPAQRFILVNLIKYRPGDRLESGALLEQITPDGVQLLFRGKRFNYRP
jgi:general secretion pathway protein B